jgi:hypothetical protein
VAMAAMVSAAGVFIAADDAGKLFAPRKQSTAAKMPRPALLIYIDQ